MSISNYVSLFCREDASKIEGYDEAIKSEEQYDCHHRLELHTDGSLRFTTDSLKKLDLYYNRPACEFIFLSHSERNYGRGKTWRLVDGKRVWFEKEEIQ